jgi:hypothetical protein
LAEKLITLKLKEWRQKMFQYNLVKEQKTPETYCIARRKWR